jgi:hypothetical protein
VVGGIDDRGYCADNADLAQSPSSQYTWRCFIDEIAAEDYVKLDRLPGQAPGRDG